MNPANADAPSTGRKYWRSLSELEGNPEFEDYLRREFPVSGDQFPDNLSRRRWLQLMGASLTLAGAVGCRYEKEIIAPFAQRPKNRIPGKPQKFATTIEYAGAARPLLVTCFDGRPLKPEGNPDHPESLGGSDLYSQGAALELYDPDRSRTGYEVVDGVAEELDEDETRRRATTFLSALRGGQAGTTVVLTEATSSPTIARLMGELAKANVEWVQYSPITDDNERAGLKQVFGADLVARPLLDKAKVILTLDRDFIAASEGATVKLQRDFIAGRNPDERRMNRLYTVESQLTITGMKADHRLPIRSSLIGSFLGELYGEVQRLKTENVQNHAEEVAETDPARSALFLAALAEDLAANQGAAVVIVGKGQPPEVHALAARLNDLIGASGATLEYRPAPNPRPVCIEAIAQLADRLNGGDVENLVVIGGNPAFDAPSDVDFGSAMTKAGNVVRLGMWVDETSLRSDLHLPALHPFESWGDVISEYGVWSISQPMIAPLHFGWSAIEFAGEALGSQVNGQPADAQALVRETARGAVGVAGEIAWRGIVRDGFVRDSAATPEAAAPTGAAELTGSLDPTLWEEDSKAIADPMELTFLPSRTLYDGRFANNGWLQEFPDPVAKVTWDNVLYVGPKTATALGLKQGVLAKIEVSGSEILAPVFIQPGQADGSVAVALGYGRTSAGKIGGSTVEGIDAVGHDVAPVRRSDAWWIATDVKVTNTGTPYQIATTQDHNAIDTFGLAEISQRAPQLVREGNYVDYVKFLDEGASGAEIHGEEEAKGGHSDTAPLDEKSSTPQPHAGEADHDHDHDHEGEDHAHEDHAAGHHRQFPPQPGHHPELVSLWTEWSYEGQAWGMAIDLNRCTGCNACAVACQAENNVPIVGKDQVARNREMHWMRIDRYFSGDRDNPTALHQPMLCQQCENAPCESVCPVAATVHSTEGLNDMVYNRCIGTRYCGNNCPYKVRRFNYLWYRGNPRLNQNDGDLTNLVLNPEVTVRTRGVMEKCTFCVQRIQNHKIEARAQSRQLGANEIRTACQQACPTEAIVFGDLNREDSRAAQLHLNPRAYALLAELNVKPRNRYLSRIRNPNPALHKFEVDKGLVAT